MPPAHGHFLALGEGAGEHDVPIAVDDSERGHNGGNGPLGTVRVGLIGGELVLNPSREARTKSELDMFVTASPDRVVMIEAGANQVPEAEILRAIQFGKKWAQKIAIFFADLQKNEGKKKFEVAPPYEHKEALALLKEWALPTITKAIKAPLAKNERRAIFTGLMKEAADKLREKFGTGPQPMTGAVLGELAKELKEVTKEKYGPELALELENQTLYANGAVFIDKIVKAEMRRLVLEESVRMSGRKVDEIRPLAAIVDVLPNRVHGSALFERGETQGLTTCTL